MKSIIAVAERFRREEDGAAFIEYAVLLGIILVASIATLALVGGWVADQWAALWAALESQGA